MMTMRATVTPTRVTMPTTSRGRGRSAVQTTTRAGATFEVPSTYTKVTPCGAGVLVKVAAAETVTKGGIVLTETAQRKPTSGAWFSLCATIRSRVYGFVGRPMGVRWARDWMI